MASVLFLISWAVLMGVWPYRKCFSCLDARLEERLDICNSRLFSPPRLERSRRGRICLGVAVILGNLAARKADGP